MHPIHKPNSKTILICLIFSLNDIYIYRFRIAKKLEELEEEDGVIDLEDFKKFTKNHPALLFPAFNIQEGLRRGCLGVPQQDIVN